MEIVENDVGRWPRPAGLQVATRAVALAEIESVWGQADDGRRVVFTANG